ncbi:molecular chaperone DnaK [candidate division KSB1 bacterium]|nr:molecular chaperone DnaK [candidate division KSB1 bacterium]
MPCIHNRLDDNELKMFESILLEKRNRILEQILQFRQELADYAQMLVMDSTFSMHMGDAATVTIEKDYIHRVLQQFEKDLLNIDSALKRIKDKSYGVCRITGKPINKERLAAIPETDVSIEALAARQS